MENIESLAKIFFYISGPLAAWFALFTWKRELKGKAKHDIAKEILTLLVQFKSYIHWAQFRSKMVSSRNNKLECYKGLVKYFEEFSKHVVEVSVHWGDEETKILKELTNQIMGLDCAVSYYDPEDLVGDKIGINKELIANYQRVIDGEDEEFNKKTQELIARVERKFSVHVR